jgi:hypothetical protein
MGTDDSHRMTGTKLWFWSPIKYCNTQLGKHRVLGNTLLAEVQSPAADTSRTKNSCALELQRGSLQLQCKDAMAEVTMHCDELKEETGAHFILILFVVVSWPYAPYQQSWNAPEYVAYQEFDEFSNRPLADMYVYMCEGWP